MRKPPYAGAAISKQQIADGIGYKVYTPSAAVVQLSRPSTLRTPDEASAARDLFLFDYRDWIDGPPGHLAPIIGEYGLNLAQPSSNEVLAMAGGGS